MEIRIVTSAKHVDKTPTAEQPYLLDELIFGAKKDGNVVAIVREKTEAEKENVYKNLFSEEIYDKDNLYRYSSQKTDNPDQIRMLDGFDIRDCLKNLIFRTPFTGKVYRNLKHFSAFDFPDGPGPRMGYRASKEQVATLLKDIQKGYTAELNKGQEPSK